MRNPHEAMRKKVSRLSGGRDLHLPSEVEAGRARIAEALSPRLGTEDAHELGFHLLDWAHDAAFLVALCLEPRRFTTAEVEAGVDGFLLHAPAHVLAAARVAAVPAVDLFKPRRRRRRR